MLLFLSYADEDREIGREIAERLRSEDVRVYAPRDITGDDPGPYSPTTQDPECAIRQADAFLALLSPDSLTSVSCRMERELALRRERRHRAGGTGTGFVRVLQIRDTPYHQAGALRSRPWFDLTSQASRKRFIRDLVGIFAAAGDTPPPGDQPAAGGGKPPPPEPHFSNRDEELGEVCYEVRKDHGERFWLLVASPQHGKTWLLKEIHDRVQQDAGGSWIARWVDARDLSPEIADDAAAILALFDPAPRDGTEPIDAHAIADSIIDSGRRHLWLLDSAQLLSKSTVHRLRQYLSAINEDMIRARASARLAVIAASRRDREWKGLEPARPPQIQRLSEFSEEVIRDALAKQAPAGRPGRPDELDRLAKSIHQLSEGLPALLAGYLTWIGGQHWRDLGQLSDEGTFYQIATPYVEDDLLSPGSLRGSGPVLTDEQQNSIRQALQALCPYRLYTQSHLRHLGDYGELRDALTRVGWTAEDHLWTAVSRTDLLYPAETGLGLTIDPPIRRLLCRYWYPSEADRGRVNREARIFLQPFAISPDSSDPVRMLVECLWHEAQALILERSAELEVRLTGLARELSAALPERADFDVTRLRDHAAGRIEEQDPELAKALHDVPGLLGRLAEVVRQPAQEHL
jgi:hypothetical protein